MAEKEKGASQGQRCFVVINAGSSSFKFSVFVEVPDGPLERVCFGEIEATYGAPRFCAKNNLHVRIDENRWEKGTPLEHLLAFLIDWIVRHVAPNRLVAVGHRMVHGGQDYQHAQRVTQESMAHLRSLIPLAPLHQPRVLAVLEALMSRYPELCQIVCFDTAFHGTNSRLSRLYGLPRELSDEGLIRYGFHGASYEFISEEIERIDPKVAEGRIIVAHLGSGASMCVLVNGKSVASTMGFTALDGLLMGTRCGAIDPGLMLYLMQTKNMSPQELESLLYEKSGLLGVSGGISCDVRELLASSDPAAKEALDLFVYRVVRETGSLAAAAGGMDAFVFTAGIGEHSPEIRAAVCDQLEWMGVRLDEEANQHGNGLISSNDSRVAVRVIPANEELMIARHTARLAKREQSGGNSFC